MGTGQVEVLPRVPFEPEILQHLVQPVILTLFFMLAASAVCGESIVANEVPPLVATGF